MTDAPPRPVGVVATGWGVRHPGRLEWALRGVELRVEPGERVLVLGRSGSGKSTLLAALAGLLDAAVTDVEGLLRVDGAPAAEAAERTGILFQDPESQLVMGRAGDDVAFGLENRCLPTREIPARVDEALAAVDFPYPPERSTDALSGGERQRLALAGVLARRPDLLLLDEPAASLDPDAAAAVRASVGRLVEGREVTLVLVEHRYEEWLPLIDRVVVLGGADGVIVDGTPSQILPVHPAHSVSRVAAGGAAPSHPLIAADGASFRYPGSATDALPPVNAELRSAEALAVTGPNGSGKSTLALLLGGLIAPRTGSVRATAALAPRRDGEDVARWRAETLVQHVGSVFQDPEHQFLTGSVRAELMLGPTRAGLGERVAAERADELLERMRLRPLAAASPFTLSGGEKRRLSVATAVATRPRVLILDEPTFGQDADDVDELVGLLAALRDAGSALCVVTHDAPFVTRIADRTLPLEGPA